MADGTVLVAGASGYVGRRLVPALVAAGRPVRALVRRPDLASFPESVELAQGDVTEPASLPAACEGVDRGREPRGDHGRSQGAARRL